LLNCYRVQSMWGMQVRIPIDRMQQSILKLCKYINLIDWSVGSLLLFLCSICNLALNVVLRFSRSNL
jgi:hypothetical protein